MARTKKKGTGAWLAIPLLVRIGIAATLGIIAAVAIGIELSWVYAPLVFWDVTALIAEVGLWLSIRTMNAAQTKQHATTDDPGRAIIDMLMITASIASLAGVLVLVIKASSVSGFMEALDIGLGVASVIISWLLVHLIFTLRYADLYFKNGDGIDFNSKEEPTYQDFAYLAFTIGMTYQVSDTSLTSSELRRSARQHALLSYVFGTVIIATTINAIAGLAK